MADKTVAEKMYIKPGMSIGFFNAPDNLPALLGGLPDDIDITEKIGDVKLDLILGFMENRQMLKTHLLSLKEALKEDGALWIAYHKGSSSVDTDLNRDSIHDYAQTLNLKGVAMVSINKNWSGFRFEKV